MEVNKIYLGDSRNMNEVSDKSVHLVVTSPPYYVAKEYESYLKTFEDYLQMLNGVCKELKRVVVQGGKIAINIADIATGSRLNSGFPEEVMVIPHIVNFFRELEIYLYARPIWVKTSYPWQGSEQCSYHAKVQHAEYRMLSSTYEYVFIFRNGKERRKDKSWGDGQFITKEEWIKWVTGVWYFDSVSKNDIHEALFPIELPKRVIKMYSFPGDIVLDPFMGSGTTALACIATGRQYIGYDIEEKYVKLANEQLAQQNLFADTGGGIKFSENIEEKIIQPNLFE